MTQKQEPKYISELRRRGFSEIHETAIEAIRSVVFKGLNRKERRKIEKRLREKKRRTFSMFDDETYATDETGQAWVGPGNTDISDLGFTDNTEISRKMACS